MPKQKASLGFLLLAVFAVPGQAAAEVIPNDPHFQLQWGLKNTGQTIKEQPGTVGADVRAAAAWEIHAGTSSVVVAIVGRGIDPHPEFADRLLEGYATVGDPFDTLDTCPHDTHLAGIIAAATDNAEGIAGLNGRAWLLPVRVFDGCSGTQSATAEGIIWAVDHGADVVLVPIKFANGTQALTDAVAYAVAHDAVIIAPAGDDGENRIAFPAAVAGCLAVSATTNRDTLSSDSNFGPGLDLAAPGDAIWSTWTGDGYAYQPSTRDTAPASAFVAGVAALVRSYAPQLSGAAVAQLLLDSADDLGDLLHFGAGRVNALRALELAPRPALRFEHVEPFPTTIPPDASSSFRIRIVGVAETIVAKSVSLLYRTELPEFTQAPLMPLGDDLFLVELPGVACESTVEYFLTAAGDGGTIITDPLDAPSRLHSANAIRSEVLFEDDFEEDRGWEVEGGDNTSGRWSRVIPVGTSAQPGFDYSPDAGRFCYITGQHFGGNNDGTNDVDGGPVRLTSPEIELTAADAEVSYARWFYSSGGTPDQLVVELSRDGGESWATIETVEAAGVWEINRFRLSEFPEVVGDQLRVRFSTADLPNDSLTEAGVDDFRVHAIRCSIVHGDGNDDGFIDGTDFALMLGCWSGPGESFPKASCDAFDFDRDRHVGLPDFKGFQGVFRPR